MNEPNRKSLGVLASAILVCLSGTAEAQIFTEDFNSFSGTQNTTQADTGLEVAFGGNVSGWSTSGAGVMHAVDLANPGGESNPSDWTIMFWQDNVITQTTGIAANDSGTSYEVTFDYGPAVYAAGNYDQRTQAGDEVLVEVLRGDDTVLASGTFTPGAWSESDSSNRNLSAGLTGTLPYAGDGSGDVRLRIGPASGTLNQGRFAGQIDNISVSDVGSGAISITSFTATPDVLGDAGDAVTFDWTVTGMPLDTLVITPGDINVLGDTDGAGIGMHVLDPGPDGTTDYTLTATKGGDTVTSMVTVTLPAPEITSFTASPIPVAPGEDVTLSWQVGLPATTLTIDPGGIDVSGDTDGSGAGSIIVNPTTTTSYTLTATRGTSLASASASAIVAIPPDPNALAYEGFDGITGLSLNGSPAGQAITTHDLGVNGSMAGWSTAGAGTIHAVDTNNIWTGGTVSTNPPNWAVMIWQDNVITQTAATPGSNDSGVGYSIDFLAAGAVYEQAGQANDGTTDGIRIEVLRASDSTVLHTFDHIPAPPVGVGDLGLLPASFTYTGDGSGDIVLRVGPANPGQGRFQGTIDNLQLTVAGAGPVITSITDLGGGVFELTLLGAADTRYEFRSATSLAFDPGTLVENLSQGDPGDPGDVSGSASSVLTTDGNGDGTVRMTLTGPRNFVRAQIPPPLYSENFESGDGGFTVRVAGGGFTPAGSGWEHGTPDSTSPGGTVDAGNGGSANCWGTNLGLADDGHYVVPTETCLRSAVIDLTGVAAAELTFAEALDLEGGDTAVVNIIEELTDAVLAAAVYTADDSGTQTDANWKKVPAIDLTAVVGQKIRIEWCLSGATAEYLGWYIDDVVVTETTP